MSIITINPATEEILNEYDEFTFEQINESIHQANQAHEIWKNTTFSERSKFMLNAASILRNKRNEYAELMALEMGKPLAQGLSEADKCAWVCEYYAENAEQHLKDEHIKTEMTKSYVTFNPLGVVLAIMPWNFPFWQVFRFAAPALMAGNAGILKHSRNTMGCGIAIENIFREAGFPEGLFANLVVGSSVMVQVIEHPLIQAVTLTGSTPVGQQVASKAGSLIKKTVMELGGSDPYIILEDADIEQSAETCVNARLINSGQSCIAAKRFIVIKSVLKQFEELFVEKMKLRKMGNPYEPDVTVGPQARKDLQIDLHRQVTESISKGAKLLLGGKVPEGKGYFYPPTVLTDVVKGMPAYDEETFGPVAAIIPAENEIQAIEIANDTIFGLGAAVFTKDLERGERIASKILKAGCCFVNEFVKSDPRLPFGGIKQSGYGRELSHYGIIEFVNIKTVCIK
ncbi:MAG: succinate-semialdehyde dehydrogenase [Ignavibacteria bacterium GWB2_35_12]|nr:MAG: succinate-semialdehyde dehydrogenase [Ignavibacteria bacterium GWA2_35_8]OGU38230.1 MAG: succinate-semialdehyde dehydrogenase [Ignavibacteria bacterium GWB2_35_12]OGU95450.1 MAG: succinate-semialdehyde dehydrogenase [Ignavibacteria bacterium RIFOXYA2_FULL_35_10]OGV20834.1 MAG: succinate-semialdehyde dehydrogenase [Ignavibacteria bacterium RIFOXYC2_FULL_35_21]